MDYNERVAESIKQFEIEITEETKRGVYANMVMITHSEGEFFLDFIFLPPGERKGRVQARVIMSPVHLKRFLEALQENTRLFEQQFGKIQIHFTDAPKYVT